MRTDTIPHGPISLPTDATFVSDADEEIFLLYTRLAALKPPDSSDTGHFHGLGTENSKEDALLVHIELKPPPTACDPAPKSDTLNRNTASGRRKRGKKREGLSSKPDISVRQGKEAEPVVLEYTLAQDITALRSRSGDTGSVLWKTRLSPKIVLVLKAISHSHLASSFCRWYYDSCTFQSRPDLACSTMQSSAKRTFLNSGALPRDLPHPRSHHSSTHPPTREIGREQDSSRLHLVP